MKISCIIITLFLCTAPIAAQTAEIVPGDNLVVQGIPRIPASLAAAVGRYSEFRTAALLDWHPVKREMLIRTRFGDTAQIHRVSSPGGARQQLTFFSDNVFGEVSYHPTKGDYFVFAKDVGGDQRFHKYRYDFATGDITLITDGKSINRGGVWSNTGDQMAYVSSRRNGKDEDVYVVDPSDPKSDRMLAELRGTDYDVLDWSPDDRKILVLETASVDETNLWIIDAVTGEKNLLTPRIGTEKVTYGLSGQFSKDGRGVYIATDRGSEFARLAYLDLASREHSFLTDHFKWDVERFRLSPDGKSIAFVTNEDGIGMLHLLDPKTGKEKPIPKLPSGSVSNVSWHRNGKLLGFNLVSTRSPSDVYSLDTQTGKIERWTFSETGGINTETFVEPELIRWKSFDGRIISGLLYRPPTRFIGKRPVIINIHGGPGVQSRPGFLGRNNYLLNELGVAIIFPNVRGSNGYGKTFLNLDNGFLREGAYKDIGTLLDWVSTRPDLDTSKIMVTGISYGGHMTLAIATMYNDRIRCAVESAGMSNLVTFLENIEPSRQDFRRTEFGDEREPKMRTFLGRIAPLNNATKITEPLFIIHGKNDPRLPLSEAEQILARVKKNGTPVWYLLAKDEGHGFFKKKNVDFQFYATVLFMKEYLLK